MSHLTNTNPEQNTSPAETGNASNPSVPNENASPEAGNQLLNKKAETYLREAGNIEDLPDEGDVQDLDAAVEEEEKEK